MLSDIERESPFGPISANWSAFSFANKDVIQRQFKQGKIHAVALCQENGMGPGQEGASRLSHLRTAHRLFHPAVERSERMGARPPHPGGKGPIQGAGSDERDGEPHALQQNARHRLKRRKRPRSAIAYLVAFSTRGGGANKS